MMRMRIKLFIMALSLGLIEARAQVFEVVDGSQMTDGRATENVVVADGFWKHWFVQMGLDMTLQNPYGYDLSKVFPNGKSFGLELAVGKWFSHQVGVRGLFNWENALPLLKNGHANWLAPFDQPGVNRDKGGYIAVYGDVLLNMHNFFGPYRADRTWNLSVYPRVGVNYNFGVSKGSLCAGVGVLNTYRLSDRWSLIGDIAYVMTGSGFVGINESGGTGTGSNSNGYLTIGIGAQVELGKMNSYTNYHELTTKSNGVLTNSIWDNWFVQAGMDMSLMNPYGCNFSKVIPKGMTFGLNAALGKWFTPEFAMRGRVQWDNGLIPNNSLEWVPPVDDPKENYKKGGLATVAIDAMLNLTNVCVGYDPERKWHTTGFVRAGIMTQFVEGSGSPLMGAGLEETYRLNENLSLFGSLGYQVSTSEGMGVSTTGMEVAAGSNGFFDIDFGVKIDLGENGFYRSAASKKKALTHRGLEPSDTQSASQMFQSPMCHNWSRFLVNTTASVGVAFGVKSALKAVVKEDRPDHSDNKSFPSGHAAMSFAAARSIDKEFRRESIWIPIAGYAAATAIGVERVINDRHHWYDVVAGAAVGIGSTELTWWLSDQLLGKGRRVAVGMNGNGVDVLVAL